MIIDISNQVNIPAQITEGERDIVIVASHERSGTHFLLNAISCNTEYSSNPYLNFDLMPIGNICNFYDPISVERFISSYRKIKYLNKFYTCTSILKSHHPIGTFEKCFNNDKIKIIYIHRNPVDTLKSWWKLGNYWSWKETLITDNLFDFVSGPPEGQEMRYQKKSYITHFERWAEHVTDWIKGSIDKENIITIEYDSLKNDYDNEMKRIIQFIGSEKNESISVPDRENYIKGADKLLSKLDLDKTVEYINNKLCFYSDLAKYKDSK